MAARRRDAMRAVAEQRATARKEAKRLVEDANAKATETVRAATAKAAALVQAATEEAATRIQTATDEANRLVTNAQQEVDRLHDLRARLATQLRSARDALSGAAPLLTPTAAEDDVLADVPRPAAIPRQREREPHTDQPSTDPQPDETTGEPVPSGPIPAEQEAG
jgi:cell division septum initiation protein DivIVA